MFRYGCNLAPACSPVADGLARRMAEPTVLGCGGIDVDVHLGRWQCAVQQNRRYTGISGRLADAGLFPLWTLAVPDNRDPLFYRRTGVPRTRQWSIRHRRRNTDSGLDSGGIQDTHCLRRRIAAVLVVDRNV